MPFQSPLRVEHHVGKIGGTLIEPLLYDSERFASRIAVPAGFSCDFGSVPGLLVDAIVNPVGRTGAAFVVHDFLYRHRGMPPQHDRTFSRANADLIMRDAMMELGEDPWRAYVAYAGVRIGGWAAWNKEV